MKKILSSTLLICIAILSSFIYSAYPALAQVKAVDCGGLNLGIKCAQGDTSNTAKAYITNIVNILLTLAAITAAIFLVIGGVRYIISQGEREATEKAKNTILYAIIGLIVIGLSAALVNFIVGSVGAGG